MTNPPPRPALQRASDAGLSPAVAVSRGPSSLYPAVDTISSSAAPPVSDSKVPKKGKSKNKKAKAKHGHHGKGKSHSAGSATSDKEKATASAQRGADRAERADLTTPGLASGGSGPLTLVDVTFTIPKRIRRQLDQRAEELGQTRGDLVALVVQAWLDA